MDKLDKLEEILKIVDKDIPSTTEVAEIFALIIKVVKETKEFLERQAKDNKDELGSLVDNAISKLETIGEGIEKRAKEYTNKSKETTKSELDSLIKEIYRSIKEVEDSIPSMPDLSDIEKRLRDIEIKEIPKFPIAELNEKFIALDSVIEELREKVKKVEETPRTVIGGSPRRVFVPMLDDLSALTDGSTKTFYLSKAPLNANTIMVFGTDFPTILRPTTDFTVSGKLLTLTSAVPAPISGATLLVQYHV